MASVQRTATLEAPPPPATFAGRSTQLEKLSAWLLAGTDVAISAAVQGMGGVGKTVLAQKLGSDLSGHFPGGVLWLEIGWDATTEDVLDRLALILGLSDLMEEEPRARRRAAIVQKALEQRGRLLAILDDLCDADLGRWLIDHVLPPDRALLITSRDLTLSQALSDHVEHLDALPEPEALDLLANILGPLGSHTPAAREVIHQLEALPLALDLAARLCDNGPDDLPWLAGQLRQQPSLDVLKLEGHETPQTSVEVSLALSYRRLQPDLQQRFRALGVFAPAPFDLPALAAVWGDDNLEQADTAVRQLQGRGLLTRAEDRLSTETGPLPHPVYSQHSLLRAYALTLLLRAQAEDRPATRHTAYYQTLPATSWQAAELFWEQIDHAWQWAWAAGPQPALAFYAALRPFLSLRSRHRVQIAWISALLSLPPEEAVPDDTRAILLNNIGWVYSALGEKERALEHYEQSLHLRRQLGDRAGEAATLNNIGRLYDEVGEPQRALEYLEQALPLFRQEGDRAGEAVTLNNMGSVYRAVGEMQRALEYLELALPLRRQVGDRAGEATTLNNIGRVYDDLGEKQRALEYYEQALSFSRQVGDRAGESTTLNNIGGVYDDLGEMQRALEYYERALSLSRQVGDRAGEATTLNNIGGVWDALGEKQRALEFYEQALRLRRQVGDRAGEATTLNNIGGVWDALGEKQRALEFYEQALRLRRQVGDRAGEATTLNNIGGVWDALGEKQRALEYLEQALRLRRQVGDRAGKATTLNNIGGVYSDLGEKQRALEYYEQALPLRRQVGDRAGEAVTLNNIGRAYSDVGEKQRALEYLEQALPLFRQVGDRAGEAVTLHNIGGVYDDLGEKQRALEYLEQALPLRRQVGDRAGEGTTLNNIGRVYSDLGEKKQALAYYEQALPLMRQVGDRWQESLTRYNMAMVHLALGNLEEAEHQLLQVVALAEALGHPDFETFSQALATLQYRRPSSSGPPSDHPLRRSQSADSPPPEDPNHA